METAQQKKDGGEVKAKKPTVIKYGLNHVTTLIENKAAKLVVIAHRPAEEGCALLHHQGKGTPRATRAQEVRLGDRAHDCPPGRRERTRQARGQLQGAV